MEMTAKERIYATIKGLSHDRPAVTPIFMAWAARYVGHSYRDYYLDGEVLVKAQLAVTRAFHLDQISAISDPWREASAYGVEFDYPEEGVGRPRDLLIKTLGEVFKISRLDISRSPRMQQRVDSIRRMAMELGQTHSVLGWVEGPLAEYADLRGVENAMMDLMEAPEVFVQAAQILVDNAVAFALAQACAGADMIGIGDAVASLIGPQLYRDHVLPLEKRLVDGIHDSGASVKLHICGNTSAIVELMTQTGADIVDLDWMVSLAEARQRVGPAVTLCGNFDPSSILLLSSPEQVAQAAIDCLAAGKARFILMPGCEVPPGTPEPNIRAFCPCEGSLIDFNRTHRH
jgi:MtaA/CmuA family methyltransferase